MVMIRIPAVLALHILANSNLRLCILSICQKLHLMLHKPFIGILPAWYEPNLLCFLVDDGLLRWLPDTSSGNPDFRIFAALDDRFLLHPHSHILIENRYTSLFANRIQKYPYPVLLSIKDPPQPQNSARKDRVYKQAR